MESFANLNFKTRNSLFLKMRVKWVWSSSSCFSYSSDECGCFIYPAMCRTHTDLLKLIKKPSMGCQIWAAVFLCNLLYPIKNLWQSGMLPNYKWSVLSKFNQWDNSVGSIVTPVSGSVRSRGLRVTEPLLSKTCLLVLPFSVANPPTPPQHPQCFQPKKSAALGVFLTKIFPILCRRINPAHLIPNS